MQASWAEDKMGENSAKHGQEIEHGFLLLEGVGAGEKLKQVTVRLKKEVLEFCLNLNFSVL